MKTIRNRLQGLQGYKTQWYQGIKKLYGSKIRLQGGYKRLQDFYIIFQWFQNQIVYHLVTCNQKSKKIYFTKK